MHNNLEENKKIALYVVNFVSVMYHLGDGVLVEFHPASRFLNPIYRWNALIQLSSFAHFIFIFCSCCAIIFR